MDGFNHSQAVGAAVARLRSSAKITQAELAEESALDQSRISRIEKGEVASPTDVDRVLDALSALGAADAVSFKDYLRREWTHIEPPTFWNPQRAALEIAEETLGHISAFLEQEERPWPLRRQIERHRESLLRSAAFLGRLNHNIAFIGDIGVGKSTAISFIFDLLIPLSMADKAVNRPILETGGGGTTICEVHIKSGPEFGVSLVPLTDTEVRELVSDFCAARWIMHRAEQTGGNESVGVSHEAERAIRNMCGLNRRRETVDGKVTYFDPIQELVLSSSSEEELRTRVLGMMALEDRTKRELWYESSTRKHPMEWMMEAFKAINNGRLKEVPLPKSIDLLIPNFGRNLGELEITAIDTKGVNDVAVREDLDLRLKDARTAIVFCSRFNDAPGMSTRVLLQHMRQTFSERVDSGKVSILALPRAGEARATKDDVGEQALTDAEGYEFKRMQVAADLSAEDLSGVPITFYNVESDDGKDVGAALIKQLNMMRHSVEERMFDLCAAVQDIIKNHKEEALNAALKEVASRLNTFLKGNRSVGARERVAYAEAISTVRAVRYAATLWASTRRKGEYTGLNIVHLVGVGAARDARLRSDGWFSGLDAFVKSLKADQDLALAGRSIDQIAVSASASKKAFLEAVQLAGVEVYREALSQSAVWATCTSEWGRGPGFKNRVAAHLEKWFEQHPALKQTLEDVVKGLWEKSVIAPLLRLAEESAPEVDHPPQNVVAFRPRATA